MKSGILIIGSLLWDSKVNNRDKWRERLDIIAKKKVLLPIRYGRCSSENRKHTYTMVISKEIEQTSTLGSGYFVPFNRPVDNEERFIEEVVQFAKAEGFKGNRIAANWGVTCLKINPNTSEENYKFLTSTWNKLISRNKSKTKSNQTLPKLKKFGLEHEEKSITDNWMSNISDDIFKDLENVDFLFVTSTAIRYKKSDKIKYPKVSEIAKAMYEGDYYEYFLRNRMEGIFTNEDKLIAKILKRKYKVKLKKIRKNWA